MLADYRGHERSPFDELLGPDGVPRPGWDALALEAFDAEGLRTARGMAARLLEDDGVTYHPLPARGSSGEPRRVPGRPGALGSRWRLDPLPTVVAAEEWAGIERGVAQRALLLEAVLADLYGARRLLTSGLLPHELVWQHGAYQRAAWGTHPADRPRVVVAATDLGRDAAGRWVAVADRTQAPSGLGYAMENRRVVARLLPDAYRRAELRRLTSFFNQLRDALADQAPDGVEDPRVVVLTPGRWSETAFDQAHVASLLGFPLVTGADLVMRDGRVWTRELGDRRPVDVVLRRVDDDWCDPLELRPDSELGVPGLLEAARRGSLVTANALGAGLVESPALAAFLPALCEALLDEPLRLPSAPVWWCGDPLGLAYVSEHLDRLVLRPADPAQGRGVYGPGLTSAQRDRWRSRLARETSAWVGQEVLPLSTTPTVAGSGLDARPLTLRTFAVARQGSYAVMPGALGRIVPAGVNPTSGRRDGLVLSKDVWVLKPGGAEAGPAAPAATEAEPVPVRAGVVPVVPWALENLFWLGRYTERAEATTRHVLVLRALLDDFPFARLDPARGAVDVLARALTHTTGTYPGLTDRAELRDAVVDDELRALFLDGDRAGSVAQSLDGAVGAAGSVRDQLSLDVFTVLGGIERARAGLADHGADHGAEDGAGKGAGGGVAARDVGSQLREAAVQVLSGTLALAGITAENMVRDVGWQLLDAGRGLERALQTTDLIRWVSGDVHPPAVERHLVAAVLTAGESVVTHRRRYAGHDGVESMLELMLLDGANPRSVAFQVARVRSVVSRLPGADTRELRDLLTTLEEAGADLAARSARSLAASYPRLTDTDELFSEHRDELVALVERVRTRLRLVADGLAAAFFAPPLAPRRLGSSLGSLLGSSSGSAEAGGPSLRPDSPAGPPSEEVPR
ncbi:circularly permuted type 2 ATP-grasp protein [Nocardioides sp. HDW12B]|uniref:circularly permuted type 2 ATP-grasp protein n=1 Tax=Nocardioides sp. HDW12B TaxID=2714939 RepID=UPI00140B8F6B|nr:circularly permuted type 2 ATP-grasp protein [Nocardioides sp. HDW12B]QIK68064.1 circularly permuted type 2 ATP-grasp protein [Nocardioides sp. HDW12B]